MGTNSKNNRAAFLFLTIAGLMLSACAKDGKSELANYLDDSGSGIIGGTAVTDADPISKTIVAIYDTEHQTLCTGSIMSEQLILTAAHCANPDNPRALVLLFGNRLPTKGGPAPVARQVVDLRINPRYLQINAQFEANPKVNPDLVREWGDVSLLKFVGGLPPGYTAAHLLASNVQLNNGEAVTLAGFGEIDGNRHIGSNQLNRVDVRIADAKYAPTEVAMDQRSGRGACHGDSGGPAYVNSNGRMLLFGVTSRGVRDPRNNCSSFAVYSRIPALVTYLTTAARELLAAPIPPAKPANPAPKNRVLKRIF